MNAALRLISGDGEFEKEWKRLFGNNSCRSSVSGVDLEPPGVRYSDVAFSTA